jgi:hypothetical protein
MTALPLPLANLLRYFCHWTTALISAIPDTEEKIEGRDALMRAIGQYNVTTGAGRRVEDDAPFEAPCKDLTEAGVGITVRRW